MGLCPFQGSLQQISQFTCFAVLRRAFVFVCSWASLLGAEGLWFLRSARLPRYAKCTALKLQIGMQFSKNMLTTLNKLADTADTSSEPHWESKSQRNDLIKVLWEMTGARRGHRGHGTWRLVDAQVTRASACFDPPFSSNGSQAFRRLASKRKPCRFH